MTRQIVNIKKVGKTVYIDFDDGCFGIHSFDSKEKRWHDKGITPQELAEARRLSVKDGKWTNWRRPRRSEIPSTSSSEKIHSYEEPLHLDEEDEDLAAQDKFRREEALYQQRRKDRNDFSNDFCFDSMYGEG